MFQHNQTLSASQSPALNSTVWQKLKDFRVDEPGLPLSFVKRLARENRWSLHYTERVFDEYKRFIFLAVAAGHRVTPSDEVDQAWHLHLAYTESYWTELCGNLLGQPLHHGPTKGGQQEDDKFFDCYNRTLESYEHFFGQKPPADIWPSPEQRFDQKLRFARLNTGDYWLLKKPDLNFKRLAAYAALTLFSGLTLSACAAASSGGVMVSVLIGLVIAFFVIVIVRTLSNQNRQSSDVSGGDGCGADFGSGCDSGNSGGDSGNDGGSSGCSSSGCSGGGCGGGGCSS